MKDPIDQLTREVARDGKPTLAWLVEWSAGGREPVAAAWEVSRDYDAMEALLILYQPEHFERSRDAIERTLGPGWYHRNGSELVAVLRTVVPVPPTLDEILRKRGASP